MTQVARARRVTRDINPHSENENRYYLGRECRTRRLGGRCRLYPQRRGGVLSRRVRRAADRRGGRVGPEPHPCRSRAARLGAQAVGSGVDSERGSRPLPRRGFSAGSREGGRVDTRARDRSPGWFQAPQRQGRARPPGARSPRVARSAAIRGDGFQDRCGARAPAGDCGIRRLVSARSTRSTAPDWRTAGARRS